LGKTVFALYEARLLLEGELAAFCAERATDEDLQKLEELVTQMQAYSPATEEICRSSI
jgi:DNA-binding FadR family transcriptional regulator